MAARESREDTISSEASVKVLFLDIDGVVNNKRTKEKFEGFKDGFEYDHGQRPIALALDLAAGILDDALNESRHTSWRLFQNSGDELADLPF
jgi:hypothetical protein